MLQESTRLPNANVVTRGKQFAHDSPKKMSVAMIPVGEERVVEHHDTHDVRYLLRCSGIARAPGVDAEIGYRTMRSLL